MSASEEGRAADPLPTPGGRRAKGALRTPLAVMTVLVGVPLLFFSLLYGVSDGFRTFVHRWINDDTPSAFHDRAYDELCKDGSLLLADATRFDWDTVYLDADTDMLVRKFGQAARAPSYDDDPGPAFVFVADGKVVRVVLVSGALTVEGGNRAWPHDVRIEFTEPPTAARTAAKVSAELGPPQPVAPTLVRAGCTALDIYR
ncbi:hypothetical protein GCM10023205_80500 [Yinghuangia aomiensis]|uniref:Uncharacterized protein n=1 Tax=Yinghuangia aomiensis TaxID=676205 RepID=A0ABP9IEC4_9ACTN